jgi:hypothetical protein
MKRLAINVSFREQDEPLYRRIVKSCPKIKPLADHARDMLGAALDCTCCAVPQPKRRISRHAE